MTLYKYGLFITLLTHFKAIRVPLVQNGQYLHSWELTITNGIRVDLRPRCGGLLAPVGVFVCLAPQSHVTQR